MSLDGETGGPALIWCPFPDQDSAAKATKSLLDEKLIACANIVPAMLSLFEWNEERGEARDAGMLLKTNAALLDKAISRLAGLHPYDQPAIAGWRCDTAFAATIAWLGRLAK
jgi:periplasmic divalent cation tolerance protein